MNSFLSPQQQVYKFVKDRGYVDGYDADQLAARQIPKLVEELYELAVNFRLPAPIHGDLKIAAKYASFAFDNPSIWGNMGPLLEDSPNIVSEVADLQVVIFVLSEALGIDSIQEALKKAGIDVTRGVRPQSDPKDK